MNHFKVLNTNPRLYVRKRKYNHFSEVDEAGAGALSVPEACHDSTS